MSNKDVAFFKSALTRFSHDLAGVIGAVSSSLELLSELGGADAETLDLARDNAVTLMGRLRFFRAAFGNEGPLSDMASTRRVLEEYLKTIENKAVRFSCEWQADDEVPLFYFRLLLLAGQVAAESLTRGGKITFTARAGDRKITVAASGAAVSDVSVSDESARDVTPKAVPFVFLRECLAERNWGMDVTRDENGLALTMAERR